MGLFSKKKKDTGNPYADGQVPYANPLTPYQQARNNMAQGAPAGIPSGPGSNAPPASSSNSGFGDDKYGNQSGYGSERYGSSSRSTAPSAGGYGGFDDSNSKGKSDLFAGASARYQPPQPNQQQNAAPPPYGAQAAPVNRNPALFGAAPERYNPYAAAQQQAAGGAEDEYGGYGAPRELTGELTPNGRDTGRI